jgi:hypothetical protein
MTRRRRARTVPRPRLCRSLLGALLALAVLALPAAVDAAKPGHYKGKLSRSGYPAGKVTFKVVGNKMRKFKAVDPHWSCPGGPTEPATVGVGSARIKHNHVNKVIHHGDNEVDLKAKFKGERVTGSVYSSVGSCGKYWTFKARLKP